MAGSPHTLDAIREAFRRGDYEFSLHADREAVAEAIAPAAIEEAVERGTVLEDYPEHRRGACCLIAGETAAARWVHVVVAYWLRPMLVVTVYEPRPPKWITLTQRGS